MWSDVYYLMLMEESQVVARAQKLRFLAWIPVPALPSISSRTSGKLLDFSRNQFFLNVANNTLIHQIFGRLNEIIYVKYLGQCFAHGNR